MPIDSHQRPNGKPNPAYSSEPPDDAPPHRLGSTRAVLILTLIFYVVYIHITFSAYIPIFDQPNIIVSNLNVLQPQIRS